MKIKNYFRKFKTIEIVVIFLLAFYSFNYISYDRAFANLDSQDLKEYKSVKGTTKIHIISVNASGNSILIESNGRYAMIDSGEDSDYPKDYRQGTTIGDGREEEVISYLKKIGVTKENFDFYIGTHPHSDHIGSADEVIREFSPKDVYTPEYKDEYISSPNTLWDNLYVYENMIEAAKEVGANIHLSFEEGYSFDFGNATINLYNVDQSYKFKPVPDANNFSLGVKITDKDTLKSAFVGGDMNNYDGAEDRESTKIGKVDIMVLCHHGYYGSNSNKLITTLDPSIMIITNRYAFAYKDAEPLNIAFNAYSNILNQTKKGAKLFAEGRYKGIVDAIVIDFDEELTSNISNLKIASTFLGTSSKTKGITYNYYLDGRYQPNIKNSQSGSWIKDKVGWWFKLSDKGYISNDIVRIDGKVYAFDSRGYMITKWIEHKNNWYYFNEDGQMHTGWKIINDKLYYFDEVGMMQNSPHTIDGTIYYFAEDGRFLPKYKDNVFNDNLKDYEKVSIEGKEYLIDKEGNILRNWKLISDNWYYVNSKGELVKGWLNDAGTWYYFDEEGKNVVGLKEIDNIKYFFTSSGAMAVGWSKDKEGSWYYAKSSGALVKGWLKEGSTWYYLGEDNKMVVGLKEIDNIKYFFTSSGAMAIGWSKDEEGSWYYANSSGALVKGWLKEGSAWYYLGEDNKMVVGENRIDGRVSNFDSSGAWLGYI